LHAVGCHGVRCSFSSSDPSYIQFAVEAVYAQGSSGMNPGATIQHPVLVQCALAHGRGGKTCVIASVLTTNVIGYTASPGFVYDPYPAVSAYYQSSQSYAPDYDYTTNIYIPSSQFTNGIAVLSDAQMPPYVAPNFEILYPQLQGNASGNVNFAISTTEFENVPFIDGTAELKQNIRFLLRAAGSSPFGYVFPPSITGFESVSGSYSTSYVYSSLYDFFAPFEDNYFFANFVFDSSLVNASGSLETGFYPWFYSAFVNLNYTQYGDQQFVFPTYNYVVESNSAPIPGILSSNAWVGYFSVNLSSISQFGVSGNSSSVALSAASNVYGLQYSSLELTLSNGGIHFATLSPGNNVSGYSNLPVYLGTAQPYMAT
jgi:hypothetical protein